MKVKIINHSANSNPSYATEYSAGVDIKANINEPILLKPLERKLIPTGLYIEIPEGYEGQVRPRSGFALKSGVTVLNSPGTIDSDYRGEIGVILINLSSEEVLISNGDRIAQLIFSKFQKVSFEEVIELSNSERGVGGFGHTGKR